MPRQFRPGGGKAHPDRPGRPESAGRAGTEPPGRQGCRGHDRPRKIMLRNAPETSTRRNRSCMHPCGTEHWAANRSATSFRACSWTRGVAAETTQSLGSDGRSGPRRCRPDMVQHFGRRRADAKRRGIGSVVVAAGREGNLWRRHQHWLWWCCSRGRDKGGNGRHRGKDQSRADSPHDKALRSRGCRDRGLPDRPAAPARSRQPGISNSPSRPVHAVPLSGPGPGLSR